MRVDDFLSSVGLIKRRTIAKEMADNGLIRINGKAVKAAHAVKPNDIVSVRGSRPVSAEVLSIPKGSVAAGQRDQFFRLVPE